MDAVVRHYQRSDREQLTALINQHVQAVTPGIALSVNTVLSQLEREPLDRHVDPGVEERIVLVAEADDGLAAAALVHRFADQDRAKADYWNAGVFRYLVCRPDELQAGRKLLDYCIDRLRRAGVAQIVADGALPSIGCVGVPNVWPHVHQLYRAAGFGGPWREDVVLAAPVTRLAVPLPDGLGVRRSLGPLGTRLDLSRGDHVLGWIEVCEDEIAARASSALRWADVGNLVPADPDPDDDVIAAMISAAAEWLALGGVDRLIAYWAADVDSPRRLEQLIRAGFVELCRNGRGYELPLT